MVDTFGNTLASVSVDQQVQVTADVINGQDRTQSFAYLVQIQDTNGVTVSLSWMEGSLNPPGGKGDCGRISRDRRGGILRPGGSGRRARDLAGRLAGLFPPSPPPARPPRKGGGRLRSGGRTFHSVRVQRLPRRAVARAAQRGRDARKELRRCGMRAGVHDEGNRRGRRHPARDRRAVCTKGDSREIVPLVASALLAVGVAAFKALVSSVAPHAAEAVI